MLKCIEIIAYFARNGSIGANEIRIQFYFAETENQPENEKEEMKSSNIKKMEKEV